MRKLVAPLIAFAFAVIFAFVSPLNPWTIGEAFPDSAVFKTVAMMMRRGYMPYKDSFDHKGPLIYILNYLGDIISPYRGVWVIEVIFLTVTFYMLYRTAKIFTGGVSAAVSAALAATLLFEYFEYGNFVEEYAMPLIGISLFFFLLYLKENKISNLRIIVCGACLGGVLMLRPNMISVWIVFCLYISSLLIRGRNFRKLFGFVGLFLVGMLAVVVPIIIWLVAKGTFSYFIDDYIIFNILYSSAEGGRASFASRWKSFFSFVNSPVIIMAIGILIYNLRGEHRKINAVYLFYIVLTIALMVLSGVDYAHYAMILIPAMAYPIAILFRNITDNSKSTDSPNLISYILILFFAFEFICPRWIPIISTIPETYASRNISQRSDATDEVVSLVKELTEEDDSITVFGSWDVIYVLSERSHATRYSYQTPIALMMPSIWDEYFEELSDNPPRVVVVQKGRYTERIEQYLGDYGYELVYAEDENDVWEGAQVYVR